MYNTSVLGEGPQQLRPAINGQGADMIIGAPCFREGDVTANDITVANPRYRFSIPMCDFAGVLVRDLPDNDIGDQHVNAVCYEGIVDVNLIVDTPALFIASPVAGAYLAPFFDNSGVPGFIATNVNTGIQLVADQSALANGTYLVSNGQGVNARILPHVGMYGNAKHIWLSPAALSLTALGTGVATSAVTTTTVTAFDAQPAFPRTISIDPGGVTADVPAGDVTVNGTDWFGNVISDVVTFAANDTAAISTTEAFATVTSVVFPIQDGAGATYDIGFGDNLGLSRAYPTNGNLFLARANASSDAGTLAFNANVLADNTYTPAAATNLSRSYVLAIF